MKQNKVTLKFVSAGNWEIIGSNYGEFRVFAVLINHKPRVYEIQFESGHLAHGDGF